MFTKHDILPVSLYEFELPTNIFKKLVNDCDEVPWDSVINRGNIIFYGKSVLNNSWHNNKKYKYLVNYVDKCLNEVKDDLQLDALKNLKVCLMWPNRSVAGEWHHAHQHPWSFLSGIIYVKGTTGKTWFSRRSEYKNIVNFELNKNNIKDVEDDLIYKKTPKPGTLIIFPSVLTHSVDEVVGDEPRITVSFNSFPLGPAEQLYGHDNECSYIIK